MRTQLAIMWARSAKPGEKFRVIGIGIGIDEQWFTVERTEREAIRNAQSVFTEQGREFHFRRDSEAMVELMPSKTVKL